MWVYETYTDCSTETSGLATKTNTVVSTYCPHCTEGASPGGASPGSPSTPKGPLTTYTTTYSEFCSTGLQPKTYTVTEECKSPGAPRPSDYVPAAFVVTTATCHVCAETPVVATLTTPAPVAPSPAPAGSAPSAAPAAPTSCGSAPATPPGSPASPPVAPGGVSQIADGQVQAPTSPASPADSPAAPKAPSSGNGAVSPPSSGSSPASPAGGAPASGPAAGPAAKAPYNPAGAPPSAPAGSEAPVAPYSSAVPFTGSASMLSVSASMVFSFMAAIGIWNLAM
ncbi:MAG: hypothetical protein Q9169_002924 [Polycauliona sp. 2 TL-2023]